MPTQCSHCGGRLLQGRAIPTGVEQLSTPAISFVASTGTPTAWNLLAAILQGMRSEPEYREEVCPINAGVCADCGRVELFLTPGDLERVVRLVGAAKQE